MKYFIFPFLLFNILFFGQAQAGEITGTVVDSVTGEPLEFASVVVQNGEFQYPAMTNEAGVFYVNPVEAGTYTVKVTYLAYHTMEFTGVRVEKNQTVEVDFDMLAASEIIGMTNIVSIRKTYAKPIIDPFETKTGGALSTEEIDALPVNNIIDMLETVSSDIHRDGDNIYVRGARSGSTKFVVDGMTITGTADLPSGSIAYMEVITGGMEAKYGDATGGVVVIYTKSPFDVE